MCIRDSINTTSGDIDTSFDDKLSFNKRRTSASGNVGQDLQYRIKANTTSGDIKIHELSLIHISFPALAVPDLTLVPMVKIVLVAVLCAGVSVFFCVALHTAARQGKKLIPNPYLRAGAAGAVIILLTAALRSTDYLGAGMDIIERSIAGEVRPEAFILKILFTAITLGAGFRGGEIVPSFYVGATFGCLMGQLLLVSPSLCAAVGMIAVFCGVTNKMCIRDRCWEKM